MAGHSARESLAERSSLATHRVTRAIGVSVNSQDSKVALIPSCSAGSRPSRTNQGVMTMISSTLINLIVSIAAVGVLVFVLRVAHLAAGGRFEETPTKLQVDAPYDLERAA